ncbi:Replication factor A protein 2 [Dimargaris cristalligena]|nr:Replication factor A protein 2 [Dimargaris cristalligena]
MSSFGGMNQNFGGQTTFGNMDNSGGGGFGGGFVEQSPFNANESGTSKRGGISAQTIRPVTIRQLLNIQPEHNDANIKLDDHELTQVVFVANVRKVAPQTTFIAFTLEDGTGAIESRMSMNGDSADPAFEEASNFPENTYARVIAQVRNYNGKRQIYVSKLRPIDDMNEITYHFLHVIHTHLELTRGTKTSGPGMPTANTDFSLSGGSGTYQAAPVASSAPVTGDGTVSGFTTIQDKVLEQIQRFSDRDEGANIPHICQQMRGVYSPDEVMQTVELLTNEGHLYSTIDDLHVKCTYTA